MLAATGMSGLGMLLTIAAIALVLGIGALLLARRHARREREEEQLSADRLRTADLDEDG
jgi:LPXTG-motif cell wall-anchored protein